MDIFQNNIEYKQKLFTVNIIQQELKPLHFLFGDPLLFHIGEWYHAGMLLWVCILHVLISIQYISYILLNLSRQTMTY